jgi:hypothetical protein
MTDVEFNHRILYNRRHNILNFIKLQENLGFLIGSYWFKEPDSGCGLDDRVYIQSKDICRL